MAPAPAPNPVTEPFTISRVQGRYLLFDVDVIAHCRRNHNICGVLVGTIPNLSQQNVFLGVPLELMPEEARVLVERGAAYVVDDADVHQKNFMEMSREDRLKYMEEMDNRGDDVAKEQQAQAERRKDRALKEKGLRREVLEQASVAKDTKFQAGNSSVTSSGLGFIMKGSNFSEAPEQESEESEDSDDSEAESTTTEEDPLPADDSSVASSGLGFIMKGSSFSDSWVQVKAPKLDSSTADVSLFEPEPEPESKPESEPKPAPVSGSTAKSVPVQKHFVTPTTSYPPLPTPSKEAALHLPSVPDSYPLFRYLHSKGYYHMPGLRFGCHYNVYPGDPLRYHSHFAATGLRWDQKFDLLDVVGGGRLGTGTKKAYMIGGEDPEVEDGESVRAFSVEWAAI